MKGAREASGEEDGVRSCWESYQDMGGLEKGG